jgi:hypothetical protein
MLFFATRHFATHNVWHCCEVHIAALALNVFLKTAKKLKNPKRTAFIENVNK